MTTAIMNLMTMISSFISEVSVTPIRPKDTLVAFCSFVYRNEFFLGDVALHLDPSGGYSLRYPAKVLFNGSKCQVHYPLSAEIAEVIKSAIIKKYEELIRK